VAAQLASRRSASSAAHPAGALSRIMVRPAWSGPRTANGGRGPGRPQDKVELCFTRTYASWANPIEAQFGPLRTFVIAASNHPNHPTLTRHLHRYLRWRNANARHPDVLAAQRRERARIRSETTTTLGSTRHPRSL